MGYKYLVEFNAYANKCEEDFVKNLQRLAEKYGANAVVFRIKKVE
jgi:uncharacterized protein YbjQ (UPF0145 family)